MNVMQVHHYKFGDTQGGVDKVVNEIAESPDVNYLLEVSDWQQKWPRKRRVGKNIIYSRRLLAGKSRGLMTRIKVTLDQMFTYVWLYFILKKNKIDVVHLHTLQDYQQFFCVLKKRLGFKLVLTLHRGETVDFPNRSDTQKALWRSILDSADCVTAVSEQLSDLAYSTFSMQNKPVITYNGFADPKLQVEDIQGPGLLPENRINLLCVGTLKDYKGHYFAIRALALLVEHYPNIHLTVLGDGELRSELEELVKKLELQSHVNFPGFVPMNTALATIQQCDFFIMPSKNEGLGLALIEAMALEKVVIASDIPVFREFVEDGITGYLFKTEDPTALAQACKRAIESDSNKIVKQARHVYETMFTTDKMNECYRNLYRSLC